eukprot:scaffold5157_cov100-Cylindrotheca_fusiformis.AAC.3
MASHTSTIDGPVKTNGQGSGQDNAASMEEKKMNEFCEKMMEMDGFCPRTLSSPIYERKRQEILAHWEPKFPTIILYARWAKQPKCDYNVDSIALLGTLADQAGMSQTQLLNGLRSYRLETTNSRVSTKKCPFGLRLRFAQKKSSFNEDKDDPDDSASSRKSKKKAWKKILSNKIEKKLLIGINISFFLLNSKMGKDRAMASVTGYRKKWKSDADVRHPATCSTRFFTAITCKPTVILLVASLLHVSRNPFPCISHSSNKVRSRWWLTFKKKNKMMRNAISQFLEVVGEFTTLYGTFKRIKL